MSDQPTPTVEDLNTIAEQVWSSYLDPEGINPLLQVDPAKYADAVMGVCASVAITGSWDGHVVVSCTEQAGRSAAAALLMLELEEVSAGDVVDAAGEIVNIVGGNVKSMLPSLCAISLPQVSMGAGAVTQFPSAVRVCELVAVWMDEPLSISVWHSSRTATAGVRDR
jgi:chemotaxis protein CheX